MHKKKQETVIAYARHKPGFLLFKNLMCFQAIIFYKTKIKIMEEMTMSGKNEIIEGKEEEILGIDFKGQSGQNKQVRLDRSKKGTYFAETPGTMGINEVDMKNPPPWST
jgi:hypothetical protein